MEKGNVTLSFISTHYQLADIFTKPLSLDHVAYICMELGIQNEVSWSKGEYKCYSCVKGE